MTIPTALLSLLATAAGAAKTGPWGMPEQASTVSSSVDFVFSVITWICVFFFVLIVALMVVFVIKYAKPPGTPAEGGPSHHTPLEVTWTVIPLILVIVIFYVGMKGFIEIRSAPLGAYTINVTAQKWTWSFNYPNGAKPKELIVPANRPVKLSMSSQDVIHSLYIPSFRVKQDVVPGRITTLWFDAKEPGTYDLFCAEYCGTGHSTMITKVVVLEDAEFNERITSEANWSDLLPANKLYVGGPRIYSRCESCHSLDGTTKTGPSWKDLWHDAETGNIVFTDGTTLKDVMGPGKKFSGPDDYIMQSIYTPQQEIVMNFTGAMPSFKGQLSPLEVQIVIQFLQNLDKFDPETGQPLDPSDDLAKVLEQAKAAKKAEESGG